MPTIISLILIALSILVILTIILKKFPALAILDVNHLPGEKEAEFKNKIIKQKIERDLAHLGGSLARVVLVVSKQVAHFLKAWQKQLTKIKLSYRETARLSFSEKQKLIKELFVSFNDFLKKEEFNEAEEKLVEIISLDQKNLSAFFKLGDLYEQQKKWSEARQTYEYALKLAKQQLADDFSNSDITLQEIYFSLALVEKEAGNLGAALENIQEALEIEPNSPRYLDLILDLSIMKKDKELALSFFERLAAVNPDNNKLSTWQEEIRSL